MKTALGKSVTEAVPLGTLQNQGALIVNNESLPEGIRVLAQTMTDTTDHTLGLVLYSESVNLVSNVGKAAPSYGRTTKIARGDGIKLDLQTGRIGVIHPSHAKIHNFDD